MNPIEFHNVWKKFKRGEKFNSLRDAIPNLFNGILPSNNGKDLTPYEFWALQSIDFDIKNGEVVGIIGDNGAGKSTILKLLARIMVPNKGEIKISGRLSALIEVAAGFHGELTGRENIYLNGTIIGMKRCEIDRKFDEIVKFSGLREFIDTPVKRYSSGMFSRLGFSVAAHVDPEILLVDEVLSVGDMAFQAKCAQKMREMLKSGVTIVLVSHNLSLIQNLCKRVILLDKGEIKKEGAPDGVIPYYQNLVYGRQEAELNKATTKDYLVKVKQDRLVNILDIDILDELQETKDEFRTGERIIVNVKYRAKEEIKEPIFSLDALRSDGVLCFSSSSKGEGLNIKSISGEGVIKIDLGEINLAPGIYTLRAAILDKEALHPYAIRKKDIFRIKADRFINESNAVFLPKIHWSLGDR